MKFTLTTLFLCFAACLTAAQQPTCKIPFSIVWQDAQFTVRTPGSAEDVKWLPKDAATKYPEICYDPQATQLRFFIMFNSRYVADRTTVQTSSVSGTVTDEDYNRSKVTGTATAVVPYSASYEYSTLSVESKDASGAWKQVNNFGRESRCHASYGACAGERDTVKPLFKDAFKWIHKSKNCSTWYDQSACPAAFRGPH